jgi:hypothetical protein
MLVNPWFGKTKKEPAKDMREIYTASTKKKNAEITLDELKKKTELKTLSCH